MCFNFVLYLVPMIILWFGREKTSKNCTIALHLFSTFLNTSLKRDSHVIKIYSRRKKESFNLLQNSPNIWGIIISFQVLSWRYCSWVEIWIWDRLRSAIIAYVNSLPSLELGAFDTCDAQQISRSEHYSIV